MAHLIIDELISLIQQGGHGSPEYGACFEKINALIETSEHEDLLRLYNDVKQKKLDLNPGEREFNLFLR
jgi:hypothetical protein